MTNPQDEEGERFRSLQDRAAVSIWLLTDDEIEELQNEEEQAMIEEITTPVLEAGKTTTLNLEAAVWLQNELKKLGDVRDLAEVSDLTEDQALFALRQAERDSAAQIAMVAL